MIGGSSGGSGGSGRGDCGGDDYNTFKINKEHNIIFFFNFKLMM